MFIHPSCSRQMSRLSFVQIAIVPFLLLPCANILVQADPFEVNRLLDVKVAMPAADWKKMRYEHHDLFGLITPANQVSRDPIRTTISKAMSP